MEISLNYYENSAKRVGKTWEKHEGWIPFLHFSKLELIFKCHAKATMVLLIEHLLTLISSFMLWYKHRSWSRLSGFSHCLAYTGSTITHRPGYDYTLFSWKNWYEAELEETPLPLQKHPKATEICSVSLSEQKAQKLTLGRFYTPEESILQQYLKHLTGAYLYLLEEKKKELISSWSF